MQKLIAATPAFLAALGGVGLYYLGTDVAWWLAGVAGGVVFLFGCLSLGIGRARLRKHPIGGVRWMTGWILGVAAVGAGIALGLVLAGIEISDALSKSPKSEGDTVGGLVTGALTTFLAAVFTTDLEEGTGGIWPSAITKKAIQDEFKDVFDPNSQPAQYEAVFEERLHESPDVEGWTYKARVARAEIIASAL